MNNGVREDGNIIHKPVLLEEVCQAFGSFAPLNYQAQKIKPIIVDATIGAGGHSVELIKRGAYIIGVDADREMVKIAGENLKKTLRAMRLSEPEACPTGNCNDLFTIVNENFINLERILKDLKIHKVDGILFDLGISSYHYTFDRGFSFQDPDSPLDMRLSKDQQVTGADLLNALPKKQLADMFLKALPYVRSSRLSNAVLEYREVKKIEKTGDFLEIIAKVTPLAFRERRRINNSTLPFMALRMAVNSELENLKLALDRSWHLLKQNGVLAVITFHSGEDSVVKEIFNKFARLGEGLVGGKFVRPDELEIRDNPRARSAKLRFIQKV